MFCNKGQEFLNSEKFKNLIRLGTLKIRDSLGDLPPKLVRKKKQFDVFLNNTTLYKKDSPCRARACQHGCVLYNYK